MRAATRWLSALASLLGTLLVASVASAHPPTHLSVPSQSPATRASRGASRGISRRHTAAIPPPDSVSVGYANGGALSYGQRIDPSDTVRYLPGRTLHFATGELVGLIQRVAAVLYRRLHVPLTIGDLSARNGGPVGHHVSHQSGRDADLAFFVRDATDHPVELDDYVSFDASGRSLDGRLHFDTARNWALLEALFTDRRVVTERVFISTPLRARLLDYGRVHGSPQALARARLTLIQPARVSPHDNHFHIRIGCPGGDAACHEGVRMRRARRTRHAARATSPHTPTGAHPGTHPGTHPGIHPGSPTGAHPATRPGVTAR